MPDTPHPPHDLFFREVFADPEVATGLLRPALPQEVERQIAWPSLFRIAGDSVDPNLRKSEIDLLFQAEQLHGGPPLRILLLLEHQSSPSRWMPRRLLRYCERAWGEDPGAAEFLPPVVPVVFYQGRRPWKHSTQFADLFRKRYRKHPWIPNFEFILVDQTKIGPEEVIGAERERLAQLYLMGAFEPKPDAAAGNPAALAKRALLADLAAAAALEVAEQWGRESLGAYFTYAEAAVPHDIVLRMGELMQQKRRSFGDPFSPFAEAVRAEGRAEGEAKGERRATLGVVEGFLKAGANWTLIEKATGLNEARFLALKAELATG